MMGIFLFFSNHLRQQLRHYAQHCRLCKLHSSHMTKPCPKLSRLLTNTKARLVSSFDHDSAENSSVDCERQNVMFKVIVKEASTHWQSLSFTFRESIPGQNVDDISNTFALGTFQA